MDWFAELPVSVDTNRQQKAYVGLNYNSNIYFTQYFNLSHNLEEPWNIQWGPKVWQHFSIQYVSEELCTAINTNQTYAEALYEQSFYFLPQI